MTWIKITILISEVFLCIGCLVWLNYRMGKTQKDFIKLLRDEKNDEEKISEKENEEKGDPADSCYFGDLKWETPRQIFIRAIRKKDAAGHNAVSDGGAEGS